VGVVFRGHHERAGWFWADAMRAMERNADAEKTGPEDRAGLAMELGAGTETARRVVNYRGKRADWADYEGVQPMQLLCR
jgi:hypothetical protein